MALLRKLPGSHGSDRPCSENDNISANVWHVDNPTLADGVAKESVVNQREVGESLHCRAGDSAHWVSSTGTDGSPYPVVRWLEEEFVLGVLQEILDEQSNVLARETVINRCALSTSHHQAPVFQLRQMLRGRGYRSFEPSSDLADRQLGVR